MKTIAQQLNIKEFPFVIRDRYGNQIYYEYPEGGWRRMEYDSDGNETLFQSSDGLRIRREYDSNRNEIYYEDSDGTIIDNRPKEIITVNGIKYQRIEP